MSHTFKATYDAFSRKTGGAVKVVKVIRWKVNKVEVNIKTCHVTCHLTSILKVTVLQLSSLKDASSAERVGVQE